MCRVEKQNLQKKSVAEVYRPYRRRLRSVVQSTDRFARLWFTSENPILGTLIYGGDIRIVDPSTDHVDAEKDSAYVPPATRTSPTTPRATRNQSRQVVTDVVTVSQSDEKNTVIGFESSPAYGSAAGSGSHDKAASFDEATSWGNIPSPPNADPTPVDEEPNRWCVEGQWKIYRDIKMLNEKENMARLIAEKRRVLIGSLHTVPDIYWLFQHHKCEWMGKEPGTYSKEILREFYASYAATLRGSIQKKANPKDQTPL
uniref:Integrase core domain containing protein n=1 Tax=Solanum tuberosum TaxID=4113 RepID=M1DNZ2_SOLTU